MDVHAMIFGDDHINGAFGVQLEEYLKLHGWMVTREGKNGSTPQTWLADTEFSKIDVADNTRLIVVSLGGSTPTSKAYHAKELAQKIMEKDELHPTYAVTVLWLGPPPKTGKGSGSTVVKGKAQANTKRYKRGVAIGAVLQDVISEFPGTFAYVNPMKDWAKYLPVYSVLPTDDPQLAQWVEENGTIMKDWGAFEYIDKIVKNWKEIFPSDPYNE